MVGLGQMPGQAGTDESLSAMAVIVGSLIEERDRITRSIRIGPIGETTAVSFPFPVAHSGIHLRFITAVVDIATGIPAAAGVDSGLQATVVTCSAVFFQYDINDTGSSFGTEFGRGIGDYFDPFDTFCR